MTQQRARTVLVLGATGKTGRRVVRRLRAMGVPTRAASRSSEVRFVWEDPSTWEDALAGVRAVYLATPETYVPAREFVQRAVAAGVHRLVALSGRGLDNWFGGFGDGMLAVERAVRESGVEWAVMRPNNFNQNFDEYVFRDAIMSGELALPIGDTPEPFIDAEDIADVAVALLTEERHAGQIYEMSGPRALTFGSAVETIAEATGRRIRFVDLLPEEYVAAQVAQGVPEEDARTMEAMFAIMRAGHLAEVADGVQRVLGREPRDFASYAAAAAASGAWDR